jgi:uncharacterized protein (DUF305 family)
VTDESSEAAEPSGAREAAPVSDGPDETAEVGDETGEADAADEIDEADEVGAGGAGRGFGLVALALAVVVGLLFGYAAGWLVPRLTQPGDDSVEAGFTRDMIFHHAQAVEMGLIGFQRASTDDVQQLAVDIAATQQGEIGMMHAWLADWGLDPTGSAPAMAWMPEGMRDLGEDGLMPGMASADEMERLRDARGRDVDVLFLQLMIRHHLGGVHMIDGMLAAGGSDEVMRAAQTMKNVQQTEMNNLNQLLTRLNARPLPAD